MRQTPDVILVGEMRDAETIATVLTAAETGHLVLSTLHTNDTSQAVSRILDSFPLGNQPQIRQQLSLAMLAVVAQQLVRATDQSGRYPVVEIMMGSHAVRNLIRKGEDHQLYTAISTGRSEGMTTMEQSLAEMVRAGRITRETALAHCFRPDDLRRYLQERHGVPLEESGGTAWGVWQLPESELQVLGDLRGRDVLEFGCGAAQWSIALAKLGARPVGLDLSERQLEHGRRLMTEASVFFASAGEPERNWFIASTSSGPGRLGIFSADDLSKSVSPDGEVDAAVSDIGRLRHYCDTRCLQQSEH